MPFILLCFIIFEIVSCCLKCLIHHLIISPVLINTILKYCKVFRNLLSNTILFCHNIVEYWCGDKLRDLLVKYFLPFHSNVSVVQIFKLINLSILLFNCRINSFDLIYNLVHFLCNVFLNLLNDITLLAN